ncbi:MAG: glycerol-3-phosphate cytidylyltransferase [Clostridia bacterium]|nr:glycerol-3-phosphate cytidylyltransferase [Clostridia bacterium]
MKQIGILGAGTWGTALAKVLSESGNNVTVWSPIESEVEELNSTHMHKNLKGFAIPEDVVFTSNIEETCVGMDFIFFVVPSVFMRGTAEKAKPYINEKQVLVIASKGIEDSTLMTLTDVVKDVLSEGDRSKYNDIVAFSGPAHAEEVAARMPTTIVSACKRMKKAEDVEELFKRSCVRVYTNPDVTGVELCGAIKNIIALACGISKGLGFGDNTRAALITRGIAEITRLGMAMGCAEQTFAGLAGTGDIVVTSTSEHSRNNKAGMLIGQGHSPEEAIKLVGMVVEGVNALPAAIKLAKKYEVEMPIVSSVNRVINKGVKPQDVLGKLMGREYKSELNKSSKDIVFENLVMRNKRKTGMTRVITYGSFDLLHYGHINFLRRAKLLGDYLIVVLSTDEFSLKEKNKKCYFDYEQRKALLESIRYVDLVVPEESWEQKVSDVHEFKADTFVMGDDWEGKFDFLENEGVDVVYLPRTPEISSEKIKNHIIK